MVDITSLNCVLGEYLITEIILSPSSNNNFIINVYKPPSVTINLFLTELATILDHILLNNRKKKIVLSGDMNIDLLKINSNSQIYNFFHHLASINFFPSISIPTRITDSTSTLLDNNFIKFFGDQWTSGVICEDFSDHFPTFLLFNQHTSSIKPDPVNNSHQQFRKFNKSNYNTFFNELKKVDFFCCLDTKYTVTNEYGLVWKLYDDPNTKYNDFINIFLNIYNNAFPLSNATNKNPSNLNQNTNDKKKNPWMSDILISKCKIKSRLLKLYKRFNNSVSRIKYKNYSKKLKFELKTAQQYFYQKQLASAMGDSRKTWKHIKYLLGNSKPEPQRSFIVDDKETCDLSMISNGFNKYFVNIGSNLAKSMQISNKNILDSMGRPQFIFYNLPTYRFF